MFNRQKLIEIWLEKRNGLLLIFHDVFFVFVFVFVSIGN